MPDNNMGVTREETLKHLENFPTVLDQHMDLVQKLGERFKTKKAWKSKEFLKNWQTQDGLEKFYFLGWMKAALEKMGIPGVIRYLNLKEKKDIYFELEDVLKGATKEELEAFVEGGKAVNLH